MGCLYQLTSPSGKSYIGITSQPLKARWRAHRAQAKRSAEGHLQNAIRKYGPSAFSAKALVIADDYEYLKLLERRAIEAFKTKSPSGYNMTDGGDGVVGVVITPEGRIRRSIAQKASFSDPVRKQHHLEAQREGSLRKQRSETQKKKWTDPEKRANLISKLLERCKDPAYIEKLRQRPKKKKINDGLNKSARYRMKDVAAYRNKKREYAKTEAQRKVRAAYGRLYRARMKELKEQHG